MSIARLKVFGHLRTIEEEIKTVRKKFNDAATDYYGNFPDFSPRTEE